MTSNQPTVRTPTVRTPTVKTPTVKLPTVKLPTYGGSVRSTTPPGNRATQVNSGQTRLENIVSLDYSPYESLDKAQSWASAGDTMPVVFCDRVNNAGGVWVSFPLLDAGSKNFDRTFIYAFSQGESWATLSYSNFFVGKTRLSALASSGFTFNVVYSGDSAVCPISSYDITCDHTNFFTAIESLGNSSGSKVIYNTVGNYATSVTFRAKPFHVPGASGTFSTYGVTVKRMSLDGIGGTVTTVGSFTTSSTGAISTITDTVTAGAYIYSIENTGIVGAGTVPEAILLEVQQNNTFPTSHDRTSSYYDLSLLVIEGNLYDPSRSYSSPSDLKQLHAFVEDGLRVWKFREPTPGGSPLTKTFGASDKFIDLLLWGGRNISSEPQANDYDSDGDSAFIAYDAAIGAGFHNTYNIRYNGVLPTTTNFSSWAQQIAPYFLCGIFVELGLHRAVPLLPLNTDYTINTGDLSSSVNESFNDTETREDRFANALIAGSYLKTYIDSEQRKPFQVLVSWRGQDEYGVETSKTTKVRYSDYDEDAPEESFDMTEFCTNADHATIFAKYLLATRRYSTHVVRFRTPRNLQTNFTAPYDLITVTLNRVNSEGDNTTESDYYLVSSVTAGEDGIYEIEAEHFPVDGSNASIISNSIISGSFTIET